MTKKQFIENIDNLKNKLKELKELSLETYINTTIYNYINEIEDYDLAKEYTEYIKLKNKKNLNKDEQKLLNIISNKYMQKFIDEQYFLENQIIEDTNDLDYFSEKNNLNIRDWYNEYYYPLLLDENIDKEIIKIKEEGIKYYNHELTEKDIINFKENFFYNKFIQTHILCLYNDYNKYLKNQITKNTEGIDLKKINYLYNSRNQIIDKFNINNYLTYFY